MNAILRGPSLCHDRPMTDPQDEGDTRLRALGAMVSAAADCEMYLMIILRQISCSDDAALILAGHSSDRLIEACKKLVKAHEDISPDLRDRLGDLLGWCKQLFNRRHPYVHGMCGIDATTAQAVLMRHRRWTVEIETSPWSPEELDEVTQGFKDVNDNLLDWIACRIIPNYIPGSIFRDDFEPPTPPHPV